MHALQFELIAEDALLLRFGDQIEQVTSDRVLAAAQRLHRAMPELECIPAYASLLLRFDPLRWGDQHGDNVHHQLRAAVAKALREEDSSPEPASRSVLIPVCYGGELGPDLPALAAHAKLQPHEVIQRHVAAEYRVAMIGFAPGFPYLLGLDPQLAMPRRADPRQRVPAGSVAIGACQTGIYPAELPGGWQVIGRTPLRLFDRAAETPSLLGAGDRVRFRAIDVDEFRQLAAGMRP